MSYRCRREGRPWTCSSSIPSANSIGTATVFLVGALIAAPRHWEDVRARRTPQPAMFEIELPALIRDRGADCLVVALDKVPCPRCGSTNTETRIMAPGKLVRRAMEAMEP